mgnify:CR=1 FL=1
MSHELATLFGAGVVYLLSLFLLAYATDRGLLPHRWVSHPLVYTLSIGVYATSWTYYGSVGLAARSGLGFLPIYLGPTLMAAAGPDAVAAARESTAPLLLIVDGDDPRMPEVVAAAHPERRLVARLERFRRLVGECGWMNRKKISSRAENFDAASLSIQGSRILEGFDFLVRHAIGKNALLLPHPEDRISNWSGCNG